MAQGYSIPITADAEGLITAINTAKKGIAEISQESASMQNLVDKAMNQSGASTEQFIKKLETLKSVGGVVGADLKKSLESGLDNTGMQKKLQVIQKAFEDIGKNSKIAVNVDVAKLQALETLLASTTDEAKQLNAVLEFARDTLSTLDPNSDAFTKLAEAIAFTDGALEGFNESMPQTNEDLYRLSATFEEIYTNIRPLSEQVGQLEDRLHFLTLEGKQNTDEFKAIQAEVIRMKNAIKEADTQVDIFSNRTAKLDILIEAAGGLAGAFAAVQGATALFGDESKELNEVISKTQGAMALLQGVQQVMALLNKDSAIGALLVARGETAKAAAVGAATVAVEAEAVATVAADTATKSLWATLLANPFVAIIAAVAAATAAIWYFVSGASKAREELENLQKAADNLSFNKDNQLDELDKRLEVSKARNALLLKNAGDNNLELAKIDRDGAKERIAILSNYADEQQKILVGITGNSKAEEQDRKSASEENQRALQELKAANADLLLKDLAVQKAAKDRQKEIDDKALAEKKNHVAALKGLNDILIQLIREYNNIEISLIKNDFDRQRAEIDNKAKIRLEDLESQRKSLKEAEELRKQEAVKNNSYNSDYIESERKKRLEVNIAINALSKEIEKERQANIEKINKEEQLFVNGLRADAIQSLADYYQESGEREAQLLKLNYEQQRKDIEEKYSTEKITDEKQRKEIDALRLKLIAASYAKENEEIVKLTLESNINKAKVEEETGILIIDILEAQSSKTVKIEKQAADDRLKIQIESAKKQLEALQLAGVAENDVRVLQLKKQIEGFKKQLSDNGKEPISLFTLLGLDDKFSSEQQANIKDALSTIGDNLRSITSDLEALYQRQIDKRKENIDSIDSELDKLNDSIDKEKAAKERGDANNLSLVEKQKADLQNQRANEIAELEKFQKKQLALKRAEQIADTASGAANLIVASTNIFKQLSTIPFVGVPLAIATIATMFGGFAVAKARAFKELNDLPKYRTGGLIGGKSHENGGKKFYSADGDGVELEGSEFVVNKESTREFRPLLEAINNGKSAQWLSDIQDTIGESSNYTRKVIKDGIRTSKSVQQANNNTVIVQNDSETHQRLDKIFDVLESKVECYEDADYFYIKKGNNVTKSRKK